VSRATVAKWRSRFAAARPAGLADDPRPGAPRKISDDQVITKTTLEESGSGEQPNHEHLRTRAAPAPRGRCRRD
jgi:transposase